MQNIKLIVKSPFRFYKKGDQILDSQEIEAILASAHERRMVIKTVHNVRTKSCR